MATTAATVLMVGIIGVPSASAAQPPVGLATAASFSVLAGSTVTNTGTSDITADLGLSPGTAITGFPPGVRHGTQYQTDAQATQAQSDMTAADVSAAGRTPVTTPLGDRGPRERHD